MIADCPPITWSIDTTGVPHPGRTVIAARKAIREWSVATGIRTVYQPSGGTVGIVFRYVDPRWLAYTMDNAIVIDPAVSKAAASYQREVVAHELGHVLGIGHEGLGLMGGWTAHVTADDAAMTRCLT